MNYRSTVLSGFLTTIFAATSLFLAPCAQALDAGKATVQADKAGTGQTGKGKKKVSPKKDKRDSAKADDCIYNNKHWHVGTHCTKTCNAQGTICDMSICYKGSWRPYSSCFGPAAVAPNCPPSCG